MLLVAFNFFFLSLIFVNLFFVSQCVSPWVCPAWDSLCFLDMGDCFLSHVKQFLSYYLFKYFLRSFLSVFSFWDLYNVNLGAFNVVPDQDGSVGRRGVHVSP